MNFIKIKPEHISTDYTNAEVGVLIRYQILTAQLGRLPRRSELTKLVGGTSLVSLEKKLSTLGLLLDYIGGKVLEDYENIKSTREVERERKRNYRASKDLSHGTKKPVPPLDKIREDNNKYKYIGEFEKLWDEYPKKDGKKEALKHFSATVLTEGDVANISKALINYKKYINGIDYRFIKNGSTWFNNWQDWVEYNPKDLTENQKGRVYR